MKKLAEFASDQGRVLLLVETIEAVIEHDEGCTIVTAHDTHRVKASYDEAKFAIWPEPKQ